MPATTTSPMPRSRRAPARPGLAANVSGWSLRTTSSPPAGGNTSSQPGVPGRSGCDPYAWIPEAARLLRPGGQLIFLVNSVLLMLTVPDQDGQPATERMLPPYFGLHRFEWSADAPVEFHLGHGDMIRLLRSSGLEVE